MPSIKKQKLADFIIKELKNRIINGTLKEGDKLPNQNDFAAELGVSRPSLREALQALTIIGVIEQRPRFGTVIKSGNPDLWPDNIIPSLVSDKESTLELITARRYIELDNVELAVANASKNDIKQMDYLIKQMKVALKKNQIKEYTDLDIKFHHTIAIAANNRYMLHVFTTIRQLMGQFIIEAFSVLPDLLDRSLEFHIKIYNGIKQRNKKTALMNMENHIMDIENTMLNFYETREGN